MPEINWADINAKLPHGRSDEEKAKRKALFDSFDNGNGMLSLAEIDKGIRDVLHLDAVFDAKPAIMRAFQIAKSVVKSNKKSGDDFIEWKEFRFFLLSLRQYFEYYEAFTRIDDNSDHRITLQEFIAAKSKIEQWVGPIKPEAEFKAIDKNHGGFILFDEFCDWAIKKNLDLEDDID